MKTNFKKKYLLGYINNESIYLSPPSWDCNWYWGFGYLGNKNCHYHVDSLTKQELYNDEKNIWEYKFYNLKDGLDKHFGDTYIIKESQRWEFAELMQTFYNLKNTAEVLGRGGSYLTDNPCREIIINNEEVKRINEIVLPSIFDKLYLILENNLNNKKVYEELVSIYFTEYIEDVYDFMIENKLTPSDIKDKFDYKNYNIIHNWYNKQLHQDEKNNKS